MATTAQSIINNAKIVLQDPQSIRWTEPELLIWLNEGQRQIAILKPDAYVKNQSVQLVAGTKQTIPDDGLVVIDVVRNMGTGSTPGDAIRIVSRDAMDAQRPSWHTDAATAVVQHFLYDLRDPIHFYVWPKSDGTNYIDLVYGATPPAVALISDPIALVDVYTTALLDYILFRAFMKEAEYAADPSRALGHYGAFAQSLGARSAAQAANDPNAAT